MSIRGDKMTVVYKEFPVGWLKIVSDEGEIVGIDHVSEPGESDDHTEVIDTCIEQLNEYFGGGRSDFTVPINFRYSGTKFQQKVWSELWKIPYGQTISYKELAVRCGGANYSRAVANANGKNPVSIIVPCHRVISSDGTLGGYAGGLDKKSKLLTIEGLQLI